ncbi:hypothetical protein [Rhodopseudomonas sp.]|uniref:hypothetical protein n=1 Tax=Rhodopseudomonas sp. TaxID=1078 RepID=UPI0025DB1A2F|nr:hypothetical protein [Rhodopseudomonas sp.]
MTAGLVGFAAANAASSPAPAAALVGSLAAGSVASAATAATAVADFAATTDPGWPLLVRSAIAAWAFKAAAAAIANGAVAAVASAAPVALVAATSTAAATATGTTTAAPEGVAITASLPSSALAGSAVASALSLVTSVLLRWTGLDSWCSALASASDLALDFALASALASAPDAALALASSFRSEARLASSLRSRARLAASARSALDDWAFDADGSSVGLGCVRWSGAGGNERELSDAVLLSTSAEKSSAPRSDRAVVRVFCAGTVAANSDVALNTSVPNPKFAKLCSAL